MYKITRKRLSDRIFNSRKKLTIFLISVAIKRCSIFPQLISYVDFFALLQNYGFLNSELDTFRNQKSKMFFFISENVYKNESKIRFKPFLKIRGFTEHVDFCVLINDTEPKKKLHIAAYRFSRAKSFWWRYRDKVIIEIVKCCIFHFLFLSKKKKDTP